MQIIWEGFENRYRSYFDPLNANNIKNKEFWDDVKKIFAKSLNALKIPPAFKQDQVVNSSGSVDVV